MQAAVLQTALSPMSGAAARAGMTGEPDVDAPDFGQELLAATARADESAVPLVPGGTGSTAGRTPAKGPAANDRVSGASAISPRAPEAAQATAVAAGDKPDRLSPAPEATRLASAKRALPSVAAASHAAGLKLADGGVHARLPDALRLAHPARAAQDPKAVDTLDALPATEGLDASPARSATPEIETTGVNAQAAAGGIDQDTPRRDALHGSATQMLPQAQADTDPVPQPADRAVPAPSVDARAARTADTPANRTDPRADGVSSKPSPPDLTSR